MTATPTTTRSALVTGAGTGTGLALATMLAEEGYRLTLAGRRKDLLDTAADQLRAVGGVAIAVPTDVASSDGIRDLVTAHQQHHGRLDVLVNNAGIIVPGGVTDAHVDDIDAQFAVNQRAVHLLTRAAAPLLKASGAEHGKALLANISSILGRVPEAGVAACSATRTAVIALTQAAGCGEGRVR